MPSHNGGMWVGMHDGPVVLLQPNRPPRIFIDKLPAACVETMVEDKRGALWIGYRNGKICRIVDDAITVLGRDQKLPSASSMSITADNKGQVWIALGRHLGVIRDGMYERRAELPSGPIHLAAAADEGIWICEGLHVDKYTEPAGLHSLGKISVSSTGRDEAVPFEDRHGSLWIGTSESGLFRYNGLSFENVSTPQPRIFCLADDREDNLWVGTISGLDRIQPRAVELEGPDEGLRFGTINSICQDNDGKIWACTGDGKILVRDGERWTSAGIETPEVPQCLIADPSHGIWIAQDHAELYTIRATAN